jgi:hypothetical protein
MNGLIGIILTRVQVFLSQSYITEIVTDNSSMTLGHILSRVEFKEFSTDWGWLFKIYVKGSLPVDIKLDKCDCFSVKMTSTEEILKFSAAISKISWSEGELIDLEFTSFGPLDLGRLQ